MMNDLRLAVTLSIVVILAIFIAGAARTIVAALRVGGRREEPTDIHPAIAESRFTIPVSVIVPVEEGKAPIREVIMALLALNYPEFEVIVVANQAASDVVEQLAAEWGLEAKEFFYRQTLKTAPVRRIYRSARDSRLVVIDKETGRYGDALNCGVNLARYRYVVAVAPGIVFDPNALLRMMAAALRDPAAIVAASSHLDRSGGSSAQAAFQQLEATRSLMSSRIYGRRSVSGFGPQAAVVVWRRDAVIALKGFSVTSADPALDMTMRVQDNATTPGRIARGANVFGRIDADGPGELKNAFRLAALRQRAALEVLTSWRPGTGTRIGFWSFVGTEFVTPIAELWVVLATLWGVAAGWFPWPTAAWLVVLLSFGHAAVNSAALLVRGALPDGPGGSDLRRLLLMGPLEFVCYRPGIALARVAATMGFLVRGVRGVRGVREVRV